MPITTSGTSVITTGPVFRTLSIITPKTGSFDIKLKVWTANQCFDSLIVSNAFSDQGYNIAFPTAFTPNPAGPTAV